MRQLTWVVLIACVLVMPTSAQDDENGEYRLREVGVEEYMSGVSAIFDNDWESMARDVAIGEFRLRYDVDLSELPFALLEEFHRSLIIGSDNIEPIIWAEEWFHVLLDTALNTLPDHNLPENLMIGNLAITALLIDMNGDGVDEYLLDVYDSTSGTNFLARFDMELQLLPIPIMGLLPMDWELIFWEIADLDNNGDDEVIFQIENRGFGSSEMCTTVAVIDFDDNAMVNRAGGGFQQCDYLMLGVEYTFDFSRPDGIQMVRSDTDGWRCATERTVTLNMGVVE